MSRHTFHTTHNGRPVVVAMGWDRPLQYVFLTVELEDVDDDAYLYNNLDAPDPQALTLDDFRAALEDLGLVVPESMFREIARDQAANTGNRLVEHRVDGFSG